MIRVYRSNDAALMAMLRMRLDEAGIRHAVFNEPVGSVVGEVAFNLAAPEVWVAKEDARKALALVEAFEGEFAA